MAWTPERPITTPRAIADNLLRFFMENQEDAILWVTADNPLKPIAKFSSSVANRLTPVYPAISFSDDNDNVDYAGDVLLGAYSVTFEVMIQNQNPEKVISQAKSYLKAFVSMIVNCPQDELVRSTGAVEGTIILQTLETGFDPIRTNEKLNYSLQQFQIRAIYSLAASAY